MTLFNQKYNYNIDTFIREDNISYYLLGAFMTDGHVRMTNTGNVAILTSKDKDWLESIRDLVCPQKQITLRRGSCFSLDLTNKKICEWLLQHGCVPRKSLTIKFPSIPNQYLIDFIRGCFDGDGCICIYNAKGRKNPRKYSYLASASQDFILSLHNELLNLNIINSIHKLKLNNSIIGNRKIIAKHNLFKVHISDVNTYRLCKTIYYDNCLCLKRKEETARKIIRSYEAAHRAACPTDIAATDGKSNL